MSTTWSSPDARTSAPRTSFRLGDEPSRAARPTLVSDVVAGLLSVVVSVLVAAPVGLLWAALAPRVRVVAAGDTLSFADVYGDDRIAGDGYFLLAVLLSGIVGGVLAWLLGRRHGPAVVVGLAVGGLLAAAVAQQVGSLVGSDLSAVVTQARAGARGTFDLSVKLQSVTALVGWPVGALLAYLAATLFSDRTSPAAAGPDASPSSTRREHSQAAG